MLFNTLPPTWSNDCSLLVRLLPDRSRPPEPVYRNCGGGRGWEEGRQWSSAHHIENGLSMPRQRGTAAAPQHAMATAGTKGLTSSIACASIGLVLTHSPSSRSSS